MKKDFPKHKKVVWVCKKCNWVVVSDSKQHHCMEMCQCDSYGMDLEYYMCRILGNNPKEEMEILAEYDYKKNKWIRKRK